MKNKPIIIPLALLIYLGVMSYIGLPLYHEGNYLKYFGIIGGSLLVIILLHFSLKRREKLRREREEDMAGDKKHESDNKKNRKR